MTQLARLLVHLERHGSISTREAMHELECFRVSQRIIELEQRGYIIEHRPERTTNGARIMRYYLVSAPQVPNVAATPLSGQATRLNGERPAVAEFTQGAA